MRGNNTVIQMMMLAAALLAASLFTGAEAAEAEPAAMPPDTCSAAVTTTPDTLFLTYTDSLAIAADTVILPAAAETCGGTQRRSRHVFDIYDRPYSPTESNPNWRRLMVNTGVLFAGGATALVVLEMLPEESTAWSRAEQKNHSMWERYRKHFHEGPVWDGDKLIFNGVLHPYGGAAYYMSARSLGFNIWGSFLYSFCISTFFWEYGVECFMEVPSVQDLVITPVVGSIFGECFYLGKRAILRNNYRVLGSRVLGLVCAFLLDPVNEAVGYFTGAQRSWIRDHRQPQDTGLRLSPNFGPGGTVGLSLCYTF